MSRLLRATAALLFAWLDRRREPPYRERPRHRPDEVLMMYGVRRCVCGDEHGYSGRACAECGARTIVGGRCASCGNNVGAATPEGEAWPTTK